MDVRKHQPQIILVFCDASYVDHTKTNASSQITWYCFHVTIQVTPEANKHAKECFNANTKAWTHIQYGRRHLAPSGVERQQDRGKNMEIYWMLTQLTATQNITHQYSCSLITVKGCIFTGLNCSTTWSTVTSLKWQQCTTSIVDHNNNIFLSYTRTKK